MSWRQTVCDVIICIALWRCIADCFAACSRPARRTYDRVRDGYTEYTTVRRVPNYRERDYRAAAGDNLPVLSCAIVPPTQEPMHRALDEV